jgi:hypothetical protein
MKISLNTSDEEMLVASMARRLPSLVTESVAEVNEAKLVLGVRQSKAPAKDKVKLYLNETDKYTASVENGREVVSVPFPALREILEIDPYELNAAIDELVAMQDIGEPRIESGDRIISHWRIIAQ